MRDAESWSALAGELGLAGEGPGLLLSWRQAGVLDHRPCGREPVRVAGLGEDRRGTDRTDSFDRGRQRGQAELVEHCFHPSLGLGEPALVDGPVLEHQPDPLQPTAAVGDDPGPVSQGGEEVAGDPQAGFLPSAPGDLAAHSGLEPGPAQSSGAVQVAGVAIHFADERTFHG